MFRVEDRNHVQTRVLEMASSDPRVVAGAVVGSLALSDGDPWSDLDLTFAIVDDVPIREVVDDWTRTLTDEFDAVQLFDLPTGTSLYRVFLLPGCLQFDLSFTPASSFGATGPKFRLLFGHAVEKPFVPTPSSHELFGYAVHHALRTRFCIERRRVWQAEYWLSELRNYALHLACLRRGLIARQGRAFDELPADVHAAFRDSFARSLEPEELVRALSVALAGLLQEAAQVETEHVAETAAKVAPRLRELTQIWQTEPAPTAQSSAANETDE